MLYYSQVKQYGEDKTLEEYRTIRGTSAGNTRKKRARFLAAAAHVESEADGGGLFGAGAGGQPHRRHNVYAYKLR